MIDLNRIYALEMMRKRRIADTFPAYRTDDLVLMLDGIKNQRSGGRNASATVWEDLAGNMDVTLYNATWGADHAAFTGADNSYGLGAKWTFTGEVTIEIVVSAAQYTTEQGFAGWTSSAGTPTRPCIASLNGRMYFISAYSSYVSDVITPSFNVITYFGFTLNLCRKNTVAYSYSALTNPVGGTTNPFRLAMLAGSNNTNRATTGLNGNIYAVRVYDANLTAEELYAHWLIDKKRFNIPEE